MLITTTSVTPILTEASWKAWTTGGVQIDNIPLSFGQGTLRGPHWKRITDTQSLKQTSSAGIAKKVEKSFVQQHALVDMVPQPRTS